MPTLETSPKKKMTPQGVLEKLTVEIQEPLYKKETTYTNGWDQAAITVLCEHTYKDFKEAGGNLGTTRQHEGKTFAEIILSSVKGEQLKVASSTVQATLFFALQSAARSGDVEAINALIPQLELAKVKIDGNLDFLSNGHMSTVNSKVASGTPLYWAVESDNPEAVKALLKAGAKPNAVFDEVGIIRRLCGWIPRSNLIYIEEKGVMYA